MMGIQKAPGFRDSVQFSTVDMPIWQPYNDSAEVHAESDRTPNSLVCPEDVARMFRPTKHIFPH